MAIDPEVLAVQRWGTGAKRTEHVCACGERTTDKSGRCRICRIELPSVPTLSTENLVKLAGLVQREIRRRQDAMKRALSGLEGA